MLDVQAPPSVTRGPAPITYRVRTWHIAVLIAVVATGLGYLRIPSAGHDTLYAEDGRVFVGDWVNHPSWTLLFKPYQGYQHLLPRTVAGLTTWLLPVGWWAYAMSLAACALVGAGAALIYVLSADVVRWPVARLGLASIIVLVPLASTEAVGNMANLHWYLLYLTPWVLLALPRDVRIAALLGVVAFVAAMTEPQCVLLAPLAGFVFVKRSASRLIVAGWAVGVGIQVITDVVSPRPRNAGIAPWMSAVKGYLLNASLSNGRANGDDLGEILRRFGWWAAWASFAVFLTMAAVALWYGTRRIRIAVVSVLAASIVSWCASFFINNDPDYYYDVLTRDRLYDIAMVRWGVSAAMFLLAVIPLAAAALRDRRPRLDWLATAGVALMIVVMCLSLRSPDNFRGGQRWHAAVAAARATCAVSTAPTVHVPTTPLQWDVVVPCADLR
jgi:hypothetical protein